MQDLKSPNILVDNKWRVKITDFGLSRILPKTFISQAGNGAGSPHWMAPEILCGDKFDEKADVYSFGVVVWELLTGSIPWEDLNPMQVVGAVGFRGKKLYVPESGDAVLINLFQACCQRNPKDRPSFMDILEVLENYCSRRIAEYSKKSLPCPSRQNDEGTVENNDEFIHKPFVVHDESKLRNIQESSIEVLPVIEEVHTGFESKPAHESSMSADPKQIVERVGIEKLQKNSEMHEPTPDAHGLQNQSEFARALPKMSTDINNEENIDSFVPAVPSGTIAAPQVSAFAAMAQLPFDNVSEFPIGNNFPKEESEECPGLIRLSPYTLSADLIVSEAMNITRIQSGNVLTANDFCRTVSFRADSTDTCKDMRALEAYAEQGDSDENQTGHKASLPRVLSDSREHFCSGSSPPRTNTCRSCPNEFGLPNSTDDLDLNSEWKIKVMDIESSCELSQHSSMEDTQASLTDSCNSWFEEPSVSPCLDKYCFDYDSSSTSEVVSLFSASCSTMQNAHVDEAFNDPLLTIGEKIPPVTFSQDPQKVLLADIFNPRNCNLGTDRPTESLVARYRRMIVANGMIKTADGASDVDLATSSEHADSCKHC